MPFDLLIPISIATPTPPGARRAGSSARRWTPRARPRKCPGGAAGGSSTRCWGQGASHGVDSDSAPRWRLPTREPSLSGRPKSAFLSDPRGGLDSRLGKNAAGWEKAPGRPPPPPPAPPLTGSGLVQPKFFVIKFVGTSQKSAPSLVSHHHLRHASPFL